MVKNLLANWKTTSAGLVMIAGSIIHLVFSARSGTANENTWTITITSVIGGVGLLLAGDASASQPADPSLNPPTPPKTS
jgi:hypothetical protein